MQQGSYKSDTNAAAKVAVEQTILNEIAEGNNIIMLSQIPSLLLLAH